MLALEFVLAAAIIGMLLYGTQRYLCVTKTHRVIMAFTVLAPAFAVWNWYFANDQARAQTNSTLVMATEVVLLACIVRLAPELKRDLRDHEERQRMAADLPN